MHSTSWSILVTEYNLGRHEQQEALGQALFFSQVTVSLKEVFLVIPHWHDKMAPDIDIPLCIWLLTSSVY